MSVLVAEGVGVRHHRRWIFRGLDAVVEPGELVALTGPPGSGRTTALLALSGRFKLSEGKIHTSAGGRGVALGHVAGVSDPEPTATVAEHVRERLALLGRRRRRELPSVPLLGLDPDLRGRDLTPHQRHLLGLVLARMENPAVIALDDWDTGLDDAERRQLRQTLTDLTTEGIAVIITARTVEPDLTTNVINLDRSTTGLDRSEPAVAA
jgi:ABC-2 type transport system ATP-binding protein